MVESNLPRENNHSIFIEDFPDIGAARELARAQRRIVAWAFAEFADFVDTDMYGEREMQSIELEYISPTGSRLLTVCSTTASVSLDSRSPEGWRIVSDYKCMRNGLRRYDRAPEIISRRGELPAELRMQQDTSDADNVLENRKMEARTQLNYYPVAPDEAGYVCDMVLQGMPRRASLQHLEGTLLQRARSVTPVKEVGARRGGKEFANYILQYLIRHGGEPGQSTAIALKTNIIEPDGRSMDIKVGLRQDAVEDIIPFASMTGNWDVNEQGRTRLKTRFGDRASYIKAIMNLDYAVIDEKLRVIRSCRLEDIHGEILHVYRPARVLGDQTEARLVRNFLASPLFRIVE